MSRKLNEYLKNDKIQRLIYGIALVLWVILWFDQLKSMWENNSYGVYLWSVLIPIPLLIGQIIFNNKSIWTILFAYVGLYCLQIVWNIIMHDILIDIQRDFSPRPFWTFEKVTNWLVMLLILFSTNWIIWKIKPVKAKCG